MNTPGPSTSKSLDSRALKPYSSFLVLEYTGSDPTRAIPKLIEKLRSNALRPYGSRSGEILAAGFEDPDRLLPHVDQRADINPGVPVFEALDGFAYRRLGPPGWATAESGFVDVSNEIAVVYQRRALVAIHADDSLRAVILRWVRSKDLPPFRCVPPTVFHAAFLTGDAKGLWLYGVHPRRTTKADTKSISGQRLQEALNPFEDSTFSLRSGRAALAEDEVALRGTVGTTPRDALVWNRVSSDFADFLMTAHDVLERVHIVMATNAGLDQPFRELAMTVDSLDGVRGAFEVMVHDPDDLPPGSDPDVIAAAQLLQDRIVNVQGDEATAHFTLQVGHDGTIAGELRGIVAIEDGTVRIEFGYPGQATHDELVRPIRDALDRHSALLTVYYASGHVIGNHCVSRRQTQPSVFRHWSFEDFGSYDIGNEKPAGKGAAEIHANIGLHGDRSLFGWVAEHYKQGWLTCDDGPGEIADFVHLHNDGTLSLIHVKAAHSISDERRVAVSPYQVVTSQATKNATFLLDPDVLADRLAKPTLATPATWRNGERVESRDEMIDLVRSRLASDRTQVVIIQPHVSETMITGVRQDAADGAQTEDVLRLQLLETLLNSARATAVGLGADLVVICSSA